jgi:hypothetical protein
MMEALVEKLRIIWACVTVALIFLFSAMAFHFMRMIWGEQRAYLRSVWQIERLTRWFNRPKTTEQPVGKKAES